MGWVGALRLPQRFLDDHTKSGPSYKVHDLFLRTKLALRLESMELLEVQDASIQLYVE